MDAAVSRTARSAGHAVWAARRRRARAPAGSQPARLVPTAEVWDHPFRAFGFPDGVDQGVWASGVLRDRQGNGWVQIEDVHTTGYRVQQGFSGTPVWDEQADGVVGMVVTAEEYPTSTTT